MKWVLILTLLGPYYKDSTVSVQHVPGFTNKEQCIRAGNAWLKQMRTVTPSSYTYMDNGKARALCVQLDDDRAPSHSW